MAQAEIDIIAKYSGWQVFGSLTFRGEVPKLRQAERLMFCYLYKVARLSRVPFGKLVWVTRRELGEKTKRLHYHVLIGGLGQTPNVGLMFVLNQTWNKAPRCGFARHHIFNPLLNGVEYCTKCLSGVGTEGGDFYESQKFGFDGSELMLSNSLFRVIGGHRVVVERQHT